ncbi:hypothetical protein [Streptomyces lydicus]|uniref:PE domain-containing protein n=1 Tax=Streptomyces lydicus TaxID=47763 RepID=A0A1D7VI29_9ACTN|nr:hypothetical protein [Streptomyces lydicus]AOP46188.1 hypothetical protein SL103_08010 [Streptomyces lydicus]
MGAGFQTNPDAMFSCASGTERLREEVPRIARALEHVEIPSGAFGKLPESDELHSSYNEHATAAQQNIHDIAELLQGAAESLRAMAGGYVANEYATQEGFGGGGGSVSV